MNHFSHSFNILLLFLFFIFSKEGLCTVKTALGGDWESGAKWSPSGAPSCGDTLIIPAGKTMTVENQNDYTGCGSPMTVIVSGTLAFVTGKKLLFPCNSFVALKAGGQLNAGNGGGSSNLIDICGVTTWRAGDGNLTGPYCLPFGDSSCNVALPVTLLSFSASWNDYRAVNIQWATATEVSNDHFELLRSGDAVNYQLIGIVNGHGNSTTVNDYLFTDDNASTVKTKYVYYRLRQVDYDGKRSVFGPVALRVAKGRTNNNFLMVSPNPLPKNSLLNLLLNNNSFSRISLVDIYGKEIFSTPVAGNFSSEPFIKLSLKLPYLTAGHYTIICQSDETIEQKKLIVID